MQGVRGPLLRSPELVGKNGDARVLVDNRFLAVPAPAFELAHEFVEGEGLIGGRGERVLDAGERQRHAS